MANAVTTHVVHKCVHRPMLLCGVDRTFFGITLFTAVLAYAFTGWISPLIGAFVPLYLLSFWLTRKDPQMVRILWAQRHLKSRYDPGKHEPVYVRVKA